MVLILTSCLHCEQANTIALEGVVIWAIFNGLGKHTDELDLFEYGVQFKVCFCQQSSGAPRGRRLGTCDPN
jgi:hypothetical protein